MRYKSLFAFFCAFSLMSCNYQKGQCDFISASQELLKYINKRDIANISKMMAFEDSDKAKRGGVFDRIVRESNKVLDTLSDIRKLKYNLRIFDERKIGYAEVRVILFEDSVELDVIDVSFMALDSPTPCKVETFDFGRYLKSDKIERPPPINR